MGGLEGKVSQDGIDNAMGWYLCPSRFICESPMARVMALGGGAFGNDWKGRMREELS